jgi:eukaryotic-like serine/threonine-protein kinase
MEGEARGRSRGVVGPGTRLNGIYEIERLIGVGGMGEVYKGRAIQTGDAVAIKTIRPEMAENQAALALFRKEAAALHNLSHDAIVRYYVFSVDPDIGSPYLAMEYVDGEPLSEILKQGPLDYEAVRVLQRRLAGGLQAAHELGIIHRDLSPDNVILPAGQAGRAKIIDFGIARSTRLGDVTVIGGGFAGKYGYVSPEQLGLYGGEVTARSDIYSLGLVLAHAMSGRAFDMGGNQLEVVEKRRRVPDLTSIDSRMRPLLNGMLQPRPEDRPASMAVVAAWQPKVGVAPRRSWPFLAIGLAAVGGAVAVFGVTQLDRFPIDVGTFKAAGPDSRSGATPPERQAGPVTPPSAERIAQYIDGYEGGPCFLLRPTLITERAVLIEGFATSTGAITLFEQALLKTYQIRPEISTFLVTDSQCPALTFLREARTSLGTLLKLQIGDPRLRLDQPLTGTVEGIGTRELAVLLVSDDGYVHNLAEYMKRGDQPRNPQGSDRSRNERERIEDEEQRLRAEFSARERGAQASAAREQLERERIEEEERRLRSEFAARDSATFSLKLNRSGAQGAKPQILLAIASSRPLTLLATSKPLAAETLFPLLLDEARGFGITIDVAVKYFHLG